MNIDQLVQGLERQKASLERAISALKEVSGAGLDLESLSLNPVQSTAGQEQREAGASDRGHKGKKRKAAGKTKRPAYTDEFRREVVSAVRGGMTFGEAAKKFRTTWFSVREWVNSGRFEPAGTAPAPNKAGGARKTLTKKAGPRKAAASANSNK